MFKDIPPEIKVRMEYLEAIDARDRSDGSDRLQRLRQIPRETGQFIAMMLALAPEGIALEIGTSGGYSALWLSLAARETGKLITTFEVLEEKARLADETFRKAGVTDVVRLVQGDARAFLADYDDVSFCFLDCEKELYEECYEALVPRLAQGGVLVADNVISHGRELEGFLKRAISDVRTDAVIVPTGTGELVCRKR